MVNAEIIQGSEVTLAGIGVAICDPRGNLVFQLSKPLVGSGMGRLVAEIKALIEGLETALALDLKHLTFCCDYFPVYQYVSRIVIRFMVVDAFFDVVSLICSCWNLDNLASIKKVISNDFATLMTTILLL